MAQIGTREGSLIKERFTKQWEGIRNHLGVLTVGGSRGWCEGGGIPGCEGRREGMITETWRHRS